MPLFDAMDTEETTKTFFFSIQNRLSVRYWMTKENVICLKE